MDSNLSFDISKFSITVLPQAQITKKNDPFTTYVVPLSTTTSLSSTDEPDCSNEPELAPVDRGRHAWRFVICSTILETIVWGFGFTYGIFQEWYLTNPPFKGSSESAASAIGTVALAIQYAGMLAVVVTAQRWPRYTKHMMWSGLCLCCVSLLASSFASKLWHLLICQGLLFGIGGGMLYAPVLIWLPEWFVARRGLAGSIIFGGTGIGGTLFPLLMNTLLVKYGSFRPVMRIWACVMAVCGGLALLGMKPRLPITHARSKVVPVNFSFLKSPLFAILSSTVFIQELGFAPVSLYIPTYATSIGLSPLMGTLALAVFNLSGVIGQIIFGYICDRTAYTRVMFVSSVGAALSGYLLWGYAHDTARLFTFVAIFGGLSGGFSSVIPGACADVAGPATETVAVLFGSFDAAKGIGAIVGPIIAANLHQIATPSSSGVLAPAGKPNVFGGYGFTKVTLFVGSMMAVTIVGSAVSDVLSRRRMAQTTRRDQTCEANPSEATPPCSYGKETPLP